MIDKQTIIMLLILILGTIFAIGIAVILLIPEAKGFNDIGYTCDNYLSNGTYQFQYCIEVGK